VIHEIGCVEIDETLGYLDVHSQLYQKIIVSRYEYQSEVATVLLGIARNAIRVTPFRCAWCTLLWIRPFDM
jgi:hypothetical protein